MIPPCHALILTRIIHSFIHSFTAYRQPKCLSPCTTRQSRSRTGLGLQFERRKLWMQEESWEELSTYGNRRSEVEQSAWIAMQGLGDSELQRKVELEGKHTWGIAATNMADAEFLVTGKMDLNYVDAEDDSIDY